MELDDGTLRIDCDDCMMNGTAACADCVVTFLCRDDDGGVVVIDAAEVRALRLLRDAGMAPGLRHCTRDEPDVARRMVRSR